MLLSMLAQGRRDRGRCCAMRPTLAQSGISISTRCATSDGSILPKKRICVMTSRITVRLERKNPRRECQKRHRKVQQPRQPQQAKSGDDGRVVHHDHEVISHKLEMIMHPIMGWPRDQRDYKPARNGAARISGTRLDPGQQIAEHEPFHRSRCYCQAKNTCHRERKRFHRIQHLVPHLQQIFFC